MALGFKIADGYVDVHAKYDKGDLEKTAQQAADDHDKAFNKERERNAGNSDNRNTNRKIGNLSGDYFIKGMREQIDRNRDRPLISVDRVKADASKLARVHVDTFEREAVTRQASRWRSIGTKISKVVGGGLNSREGVGSMAAAFVTRFVEIVSFGQADIGMSRLAGPMSAMFARLGGTLGVGLATAVVLHAASAITALSPLLLAAIGGLGIFAQIKMFGIKKEDGKWVINMATEMGRAIKGLKNEFKDFLQFATDPLFRPIITSLGIMTDKLNALRGPVARFFGEFGKALPDLTTGVMDMIIEFFRALDPILKSGAFREGLKTWAREFPKIGKAIGDFFAKILENPEEVISTIKRLGEDIRTLVKGAADAVAVLTDFMEKYDEIAAKVDKLENNKDGKAGFGGIGQGFVDGMTKADTKITDKLTEWRGKIKDWIKGVIADVGAWGDRIGEKIKKGQDAIVAWVKEKWNQFTTWLKGLPSKISSALKNAWTEVKAAWKKSVGEVSDTVKAKYNQLVDWLKGLPGKAQAALSSLADKIKKKFDDAAKKAKDKAKQLVDDVVKKLKELPGKAEAELKKLVDKIKKKFDEAVKKVKEKAKELVDDAVKKLKELPGKAQSAVSTLWSKMSGKFKDAVSKAKAAAKDLVDGFIKKIKELPGKAATEAGKVKDKIKAKFSGAIGWLTSAGRAIIDGLKAGIKAATQGAIDAAVSAAKRAVAAAKSALGIKSPSKVAAEEIGKPFAEGIGVGIRKHVSEEFKDLPGMLPNMRGAKGSSGGGTTKSYSSTFSPNITIQVAAGLNGVDAAARRALTKELFLEIEAYRKDYVK